MEVLLRIVKSIGLALLILVCLGICLALLAWTKGLFILAIVFGVLVYMIYQRLAWRARTMRRKDAGWLS